MRCKRSEILKKVYSSSLPYQKPQIAECPEKSKGRADKKKLLLPRPLNHNTHVYPKGLTKNVTRILKRLQNYKISHSYIRKKKVVKGEHVPALSTKLKVTVGLAELLCFYSTAVSLQILKPLKHLVLPRVLRILTS